MKRDTFIPSVTTLLIFAMTAFLSCAHQNRVRDGLNEEATNEETVNQEETILSEEGSTEEIQEQKTQDDLVNLTEESNSSSEEKTSTEQPLEEITTSNASSEEADLKALGVESTPPADSLNAERKAIGDASNEAIDGTEKTAEADQSALEPLTNLEGEEAASGALATSNSTEDNGKTLPLTDTTNSENSTQVEITRMEPIIDLEATTRDNKNSLRSSRGSISSVPKIPSKSVSRGGEELNRFYMSRVDDTADSVSKLLYGTQDRATDLQKWNGKKWTPGQVLFYKSAIEPDDTTMRSFYQEKSVQPEEYTVKKGDWLSKMAKRQLGHPLSWKEIAIINGMNSPDALEVGQKIAIYPADLSGYSNTPVEEALQPVAKAPEQIQPSTQQQPSQPLNQPPDPNSELDKQVFQPEQEPAKTTKPQGIDTSKIAEQNLPAVFILGGVLVLSALYLIVRRRKSRKPLDEFSDESLATPTKLKRK